MRILPENIVFSMMYLMRLLESHPYIYDGELAKSMKFPTNCSSVSLSLFREFFFGTVKVEQWWVETFRSLCSCLLLMDIACLKTTSVLTHQVS